MKKALLVSKETEGQIENLADAEVTRVSCAVNTQFTDNTSSFSPESFDEVYLLLLPDDDIMSRVFSLMKPSAKLIIKNCFSTKEETQSLGLELQLQGFVDIVADDSDAKLCIACSKPSWSTGEAATIKVATNKAWKMNNVDLAEDDLVDEDELLQDNIEYTAGAGCGIDPATGKPLRKKACKNCSCGLAELEQQAEEVVSAPVRSACGSCYKGDAFRCASCPFLGKPAFEPSDDNKVMLSMGDDDL